jgi:hypothetical protein
MIDDTDEDIDKWLEEAAERAVEILFNLEGCRASRVEILALYMSAISIQVKNSRKITSDQADTIRDEYGIDTLALTAMSHVSDEYREFLAKRAQAN